MLKKGEVSDDADDNDKMVRTSISQSHATATLSTEKFFLSIYSSSLTSVERCGGGTGNRRSIAILIDSPSWVLSSQPDLHTAKQNLQIQ
jgi:hypothetical protein